MAIIHLSGTRLAPQKPKAPLNRRFMYAIGFVFLIASHFYIANLGGLGLALPFNNATWFGLSWVFAIGIYQMALSKQIRYSKLTIGLLISCLIISIPLFFSSPPNLPSVLPRIAGLWLGWLLFVILQQFSLSNAHKQRLLWFIILAVCIEALLAYVQFFVLNHQAIITLDDSLKQPFGIFQNINAMSSFLATGLVLSGYLLARQQRKYGEKLSRTALLYIMPLITVPLITLLASRIGWIISLVSVLLIVPYLYRFSTKKRFIGWSFALLAGICLGGILAFSSGNLSSLSGEKPIESARLTVLPQAIDMFIEKPFTGYGLGQFESEYLLYTARQHQLNSNYPVAIEDVTHPFNEVLFWGIEGGLIPVIGIILAALFVLFKISSTRKGTRLAILSLLMPIALHAQLENPFYQSSIHWITFIVLIFWVDQRTAKYKHYGIRTTSVHFFKAISVILPILLISYMTLSLHTNYQLKQFAQSYPKRMELLDNIIYSGTFKQEVNWQIHSNQLKNGLVNKQLDKVVGYIEWSLDSIQQTPSSKLYKSLILAYLGVGEVSKAEQIRDEASYLYPQQDFSVIHIDPVFNIQPADNSEDNSEDKSEDKKA